MIFEKSSSIKINKKYFDKLWLQDIKKDLFIRKKNFQTGKDEFITYYQQTDNYLLIPRYFPIESFIKSEFKVVNKRIKGETIKIKSNIKPRTESQKKLMEEIVKYKNVILQSPPGSGKTVTAIYGICKLKKKTIILAHRDFIVKQWRDRLLLFTDIKKDDIAILKRKTYKKDLQKPIILSTVQQIASLIKSKDILKDIRNSNIGISIYDELHTTVGAPSFSLSSLNIPSEIYWGISATPFDSTATKKIINYHFNNIIKSEDLEGTIPPDVYVFFMDYGIVKNISDKYLYFKGNFQRSRYIKQISKRENVLNFIKEFIEKLYKAKRKTIIFGEQYVIIDKLFSMISIKDKTKFIINTTMDVLKSKIIFSTTTKCRDSLDCPDLDTAIIMVPVKNIEQLAGRISRKHDKKQYPLLIDIVDIGCKEIRGSIFKRMDFYSNKCRNVKYFSVQDDKKIKSVNRKDIYNLINNSKDLK